MQSPTFVIRFVLCVLAMFCGPLSGVARADEEADLRKVLALMTSVKTGDDYAAVQKQVPELEKLKVSEGANGTAKAVVKVGKRSFAGEFNFSKGGLVSWGFSTSNMTHTEAHDFLIRCVRVANELYGEGVKEVSMPEDSDGPRDCIGISFNWTKKETLVGIDFHFRKEFSTVSWGAQAAHPKQQ